MNEKYEAKEKKYNFDEMVEALPPNYKEMMIYRLGLRGEEPHILDETGQKFHITRNRVRQIEAEMFKKFRKREGCRRKDFLD